MSQVFGFERLQQLLAEFAAENRGLQLSLVADCSFTDEMVKNARSRDELVEFAKSLVVADGEYYRRLPDDLHDIVNGLIGIAEHLAEIVRELEPLFPCPQCGNRVSDGNECEECNWTRPAPYRGPSLFDDAAPLDELASV